MQEFNPELRAPVDTKLYYFYLWKHTYLDEGATELTTRTCIGITSNPWNRIHGYEGHVGHVIKFANLWAGPERLIRELETKIKRDFYDYMFVGSDKFRYEWVDERIPYQSIYDWVKWETENTYIGIEEVTPTTHDKIIH